MQRTSHISPDAPPKTVDRHGAHPRPADDFLELFRGCWARRRVELPSCRLGASDRGRTKPRRPGIRCRRTERRGTQLTAEAPPPAMPPAPASSKPSPRSSADSWRSTVISAAARRARRPHRAQRRRQDHVFNVLTGVYRADARATIRFPATSTSPACSPPTRPRLGVARTFQNIRLFGDMTALDNVHGRAALPHRKQPACVRDRRADARGSVREEAERAATSAWDCSSTWVSTGAPAEELAKNLPYGDQRRLEIARALATAPDAAAARRAGRGHEPAGDRRAHGPHPPTSATRASPSSSSSTT